MKKGELKDNLFKKLKKKSQKSIPISCSSVRKYSIRIWRRTKVNLSFYSGWFISWSLFGVYKINTCVNLLLKLIYTLLIFFIKKDDWLCEYTVFIRLCRYLFEFYKPSVQNLLEVFHLLMMMILAWCLQNQLLCQSIIIIFTLLFWMPIFFFTLLIHRYHNLSPNTIKPSKWDW